MLDITEIESFLHCQTPEGWLQAAVQNQDMMLIDHAHCERKAAQAALSLMYHYPDQLDLVSRMSRLAREELRHFEQVLSLLKQRNIAFVSFTPAKYAGELHRLVELCEPYRITDRLIVGAIIEARSCERFARVAPLLDAELAKFYCGLLASEARHFQHYLQFATELFAGDIQERVNRFLVREAELIQGREDIFRFHSGVP